MAEFQDFVYDELPRTSGPSSHAIRLLKIHAGHVDTQPECSLETYNYETCPGYWALSYTWGPETPSNTILVNGCRFRVRQNLFNFVKAFRSPHNADFYLWIDQLCINQDNIPERNDQVRCMGLYYSGAICVLTWLGLVTPMELAAMACINQIDPAIVPPPKPREPLTIDLLGGFRSIIANPYFERLWVVQEMARAKDILVMMADQEHKAVTTTWRRFNMALIQVAMDLTIVSKTTQDAQQELMLRQEIRDRDILFQLLEVKKHKESMDIFDLIDAFSDFKCADPRDKLFALLDIGHLRQQMFTIDYGKNIHQVYGEFLIECLKWAEQSGHSLSHRQFDIISKLAGAMGLQVHLQVAAPNDSSEAISPDTQAHGGQHHSTSQRVRAETIGSLKQSIDYVTDKDIRVFGPRYDDTGHRISPFSKNHCRGRIPTIFRVPASVDLGEMTKTALQSLSNRLDPHQSMPADFHSRGAIDSSATDTDPEGYQVIEMLSGDVTHWELPPDPDA